MLRIIIEPIENYNEETNTFTMSKEQLLVLEHSLVSISKWESKWHKSFLKTKEKNLEETIDYIRCMTINSVHVDFSYNTITEKNIDAINEYIEDPMTATTFKESNNKTINREIITAELVYYWMVALNIPFECQKWHLNKLLTLINVCNIKNNPPKHGMNKRDLAHRNSSLNAARKRR